MSRRATDRNPIVITGAGALTCVGLNAPQTCASLRAGINRVAEYGGHECLRAADAPVDEDGDVERLIAGCVPTIEAEMDGRERLLALAEPALAEVRRDGGLTEDDLRKCALLIALPAEDEAVATLELNQHFETELRERTGLQECCLVETNRSGHTGFCEAVPRAVELLRDGRTEFCLIGGIDSWLPSARLKLMDEAWRLHSDRAVDGFIPGEAAVFLLLESAEHAAARQQPARAVIGRNGFGREKNTIADEANSTGAGLAKAIAAVGGKSMKQPWAWVLCDLNGESYRSFEWGTVTVKLPTAFADPLDLRHAADCLGDVGAASGALAAAWFCEAVRRGYAPADQALLWTSSDNGRRAALGLHRPDDRS